KTLGPVTLTFGRGDGLFAMNRREPTAKGIINGKTPTGPVDHSVPVLVVSGADGKPRAVVFGYACHNTTLQFFKWCGDYAGFAQEYLQEKHPGALALFWIGCGADANPLPRSTLELCQKYGRELAHAVDEVLRGSLTPVEGTLAARYECVALPFDQLPTKEKLAADLLSKTPAVRHRAERLSKLLEAGGKIDDHYRANPIQVWRLGKQLIWVSLGGEVAVDYAL